MDLKTSRRYKADTAVSSAQLGFDGRLPGCSRRPTRAACGFGQASARLLAGR